MLQVHLSEFTSLPKIDSDAEILAAEKCYCLKRPNILSVSLTVALVSNRI